ncbi:multiheme c-type cytochrome [Aestuariirhabdus sp. LZHN29]|uniref:multiheme c-type cytochrome n=1 Tax=Aestuariirhabdus sp. LZHN29 TaxID=3417462 RepID=UPI003CE73F3D
MRLLHYLTAALLPLLFMATSQAAPITLVYSGNLDGELEPCGCSEAGDMGGLKRRATVLQSLRDTDPGLVTITAGGLLSAQMTSNKIKNSYILTAIEQLNYDGVGLQWSDLAYGFDSLRSAELPWVASNWKGDEFSSSILISRPAAQLHYFQWLDPETSPYRQMGEANRKVDTRMGSLSAQLEDALDRGETTVVGTTLSLQRAQSELPLELIDLLLIEPLYEEIGEPRQLGQTLVLQPGSRGMRLGKLALEIEASGRISQWQHEVITLPPSVADSPALAQWYSDYNEEIKLFYQRRVEQRKALTAGTSPYVGNQQCALCHAESAKIWQGSEHAKAIADLQAVGKSYDPECLACHTVGLGVDGGYLDQFATPHLANVQCENCHGAGREHAKSAGQTPLDRPKPDDTTCRQCHNPSHSPGFDFSTYWPRIKHGKESTQ